MFGGLTANFASTIFRTDDNVEANTELLLDEMRELRQELKELTERIDSADLPSREVQPASAKGFSLSAVGNIIRRPTSIVSNMFRRSSQAPEQEETGDDSHDRRTDL